jgi:N-acetylmuramoyl-L-alanine amidase
MSFNEVEFRLSDRIPVEGGRFRVSQRDIDSLLAPLLAPPKRTSRPIRRIAINAGHGGRDPGNTEGRRMEKTYTLDLAIDLARHLKSAGFQVVFIRSSDRFIALPDRAEAANRADADLYVSLHFNGFDGPGNDAVQGLETYCLTPAGAPSSNDSQRRGRMAGFDANRFDRENITLAHLVHRAILDQTPLADRGVRRARFKELTLLRMPGLLIEGGYMTHPGDTRLMDSRKSRDQLASAIADGILRHKKLVERGTPE